MASTCFRHPRRRRAFVRVAGALIVALVAAVVAVDFGVGRFTSYQTAFLPRPGAGPSIPSWTRPCWRRLDSLHPYSLKCGRVRGIVVWVQRHDPDGDGDRHLLVLAGYHLVSVKIPVSVSISHLPGLGSVVTAAGRLDRGGHGELSIRVGMLNP